MTKYEYYNELSKICDRAVKALSILEKENQTLIDFYSASKLGFSEKLNKMQDSEKKETIQQNQKDGLKRRKSWIKEIEQRVLEK